MQQHNHLIAVSGTARLRASLRKAAQAWKKIAVAMDYDPHIQLAEAVSDLRGDVQNLRSRLETLEAHSQNEPGAT